VVGPDSWIDYVPFEVWGMLYADDAFIVSRSPNELAKNMGIIGDLCRAFGLTVSKKTETMCLPAQHTPTSTMEMEAAGQRYKQAHSFTYLGCSSTEIPDVSTEIARRTRVCWIRTRGYQRELYDRLEI